jgi:excisionase family DNA binding protein
MSTVKTTYPKFVAPSIAAETFGVSLQTLRRWAREGKVSYIRTPGGRFRYNVEALISVSAPAAPKPKKPAKASRKPVQAETEVPASTPAPKAETAPATLLEPLAAMPAPKPEPKPERVAPKPPLGADALRSQFAGLAGASRW